MLNFNEIIIVAHEIPLKSVNISIGYFFIKPKFIHDSIEESERYLQHHLVPFHAHVLIQHAIMNHQHRRSVNINKKDNLMYCG